MKYKRLTQRDIIQERDEYRTNWGSWTTIEPEYVGKRKGVVLGWYVKMRRKPDEESVIIGRTQALEFIGALGKEWRDIATKYNKHGEYAAGNAFEECANMLESKMEDFAGIK